MVKFRASWLGMAGISLLAGCLVMDNSFTKLPPGKWRATLNLNPPEMPAAIDESEIENRAFVEVAGGELPFEMEVGYDEGGVLVVEILNAGVRTRIDSVAFGRGKSRAIDTFQFSFGQHGSVLVGTFQERVLKGYWIPPGSYQMPISFSAEYGRDYRFTQLVKMPRSNISGRWEVVVFDQGNRETKGVLEFQQQENQLLGSYLTTDLTFTNLEGTVQDDKLYLSFFDGREATLLEGKITTDSTLIGSITTATSSPKSWQARRNATFELPTTDSLSVSEPVSK